MSEKRRDRNRNGGALLILAAALLIGGAAYAAYVSWNYKKGRDTYSDMSDAYIRDTGEDGENEDLAQADAESASDVSAAADATSSAVQSDSATGQPDASVTPDRLSVLPEDAPERISVDWEHLSEDYEGIVAWLALPALELDYPVMQAEDNDYWLHHAPDGSYLYAGSIFMDSYNSAGLENSNTILYGHNMRDGSMFARLKDYNSVDCLTSCPYFWVYTPAGSFLYRIFSVHKATTGGSTYTVRFLSAEDFAAWLVKMADASDADTGDAVPDAEDTVVTLSTCTGDKQTRQVAQGYLVYRDLDA